MRLSSSSAWLSRFTGPSNSASLSRPMRHASIASLPCETCRPPVNLSSVSKRGRSAHPKAGRAFLWSNFADQRLRRRHLSKQRRGQRDSLCRVSNHRWRVPVSAHRGHRSGRRNVRNRQHTHEFGGPRFRIRDAQRVWWGNLRSPAGIAGMRSRQA